MERWSFPVKFDSDTAGAVPAGVESTTNAHLTADADVMYVCVNEVWVAQHFQFYKLFRNCWDGGKMER